MTTATQKARHPARISIRPGIVMAALGICAMLLGGAAHAADQRPAKAVEVKLTQALVVEKDGKELLLNAEKVLPGDVIEYRVTYTNISDKVITKMLATLPLGEGLEYMARSAKPGGRQVLVATKAGQYSAEPLKRAVAGKKKPELVPYSEYRSLQWTVPKLKPKETFTASARARVFAGSKLAMPQLTPASSQVVQAVSGVAATAGAKQ